MDPLSLSVLGCEIRIRCADARLRTVLESTYGPMACPARQAWVEYAVHGGAGSAFVIERPAGPPIPAADETECLSLLENEMIVDLQRQRPDLYFVHGAVVAFAGRAIALVAPSGVGKSTTAWALSHHGFRYLSDELCPVDLASRMVHPFLRAPCLKAEPPSYPLPATTVRTPRASHVPVDDLAGGVCREPVPFGAIVFLYRDPRSRGPAIRRATAAEAAARLLVNALNPLAHRGSGLDDAIELASTAACFGLVVDDLASTCRLVRATLDELWADAGPEPTRPDRTPEFSGTGSCS